MPCKPASSTLRFAYARLDILKSMAVIFEPGKPAATLKTFKPVPQPAIKISFLSLSSDTKFLGFNSCVSRKSLP